MDIEFKHTPRHSLKHDVPPWVDQGSCFFITICCTPRGKNQLAQAEISTLLFQSVGKLHNNLKWWCHLCLLMPDHLHALLSFPTAVSMTETITGFKAYQNRYHKIQWQDNFFDHRLRSEESLDEKTYYIRSNPVRAGLCSSPEDWPYVWSDPNKR